MKITKIYKVGEFNIIQIIGTIDDKPVAKCLAPIDTQGNPTDISSESPEVQAACNEAWTTEVTAAYKAHKAQAI